MENVPEIQVLQEAVETYVVLIAQWLKANAFVVGNLAQVLLVGLAFLASRQFSPRFHKWIETLPQLPHVGKYLERVTQSVLPLTMPVMWLILQWLSVVIAAKVGWSHHLIEGVVSLLTAWVIIRLATTAVANPSLSRFIAGTAWTIAALNIVGLLGPATEILDSMALNLGEVRVSLLGIVKAVIAVGILMWLASFTSGLFESRLKRMPTVTPSMAVLFGKLFRIVVFTLAFIIGLDSVGIDLTAFAVFSGAVGLGVGFGLQKVISNLISGMILLIDRSVKPGDIIAVGGTYGSINALGARYVSVITRDSIEHLIPNEELISQRVENWSYSNQLVRLRMPIGIDYEADVPAAIELAIKAVEDIDRILSDPKPACLLTGFGDNSVDLELRVWIRDPQNGLANVKSVILLNVWNLFKENGVNFPYPQRDLHIRSSVPIPVVRIDESEA